MSGALTAMVLGQQNPILLSTQAINLTPSAGQTLQFAFNRNGTCSHTFLSPGTATLHPPQWGSSAPLPNMGDLFEIRATLVLGTFLFDTEFDQPNLWLRLNTDRRFASGLLAPNSYSCLIRFEIRRFGGAQVLTTATWNGQWVVANV